MSRPKQCRRIQSPPLMSGFKPFGIPRSVTGEVILQYDEYEAIRLLDYEGLLQEEAAERMNVSRPHAHEDLRQGETNGRPCIRGRKIVGNRGWQRGVR